MSKKQRGTQSAHTAPQPTRPASSTRSAPPPTTRRSRQHSAGGRQSDRALRAASSKGPASDPIVRFTVIAVVIAIALIGTWLLLGQGNSSKATAAVQSPAIVTPATIQTSGTSGMTLGDPNAKVTLTLYSDFQCPNCGIFFRDVEPTVLDKYVKTGQVKIEWKDFPVIDQNPPVGTESRDAANAARCAGDQGKYWAMHDWLYANQGEKDGAFTQDRLLAMGQKVGLPDYAKFETCVKSGTHNAEIAAEPTPPADAQGVQGTPTIVINGKLLVVGVPKVDTLDKALADAVSGGSSASPSPSASASSSPSSSPSPAASASAS